MLENPVDEGDAETHYDLGLAYKEMGLYDEAIKAFEKVAQSSVAREVQSRMMIGLCQREQLAEPAKMGPAAVGMPAPADIHPRRHGGYRFSAKGADLYQPGATPQEASHLPFER